MIELAHPTVESIFSSEAVAPSEYDGYGDDFYSSLTRAVCDELNATVDNRTEQWHLNADSFLKYILEWYPDDEVAPAIKMAISEYQLPLDPSKLSSFDSHDGRLTKLVMASIKRSESTDD